MMGQTAAQRHNAMMDRIFETARQFREDDYRTVRISANVWAHLEEMATVERTDGDWTAETANERCARYAYLLGVLLGDAP